MREKFYPTLNAFRLLVRVGPVFLGVVCLVYTFWLLGNDWAFVVIQRLIGVHGQHWGLMNHEIASLHPRLLFETLRIALLAAAFDLCISVGAERRAEAAEAADERRGQGAASEEPAPQRLTAAATRSGQGVISTRRRMSKSSTWSGRSGAARPLRGRRRPWRPCPACSILNGWSSSPQKVGSG